MAQPQTSPQTDEDTRPTIATAAAAQSPHQGALPERPQLAPDVRLAGQMQESAFKDPPWLLERGDAGYVQVTRPLYRIAELCDGQHTVAEIAADVSESTGSKLGPDAIQRLIAGQLIAKGLVEQTDGSVAQVQRSGGSLLALNMKMKAIGPETIEPVARILQVLYWPPIFIVMLALATVAEVWLYFVHGVGESLHDTIYEPGLLVLVYLVIVAAAGFHEFGHAAALHYAGGRVKTMGAGFYLVYPAFYTDVSDNYRLGRWARVRTDLAGFYFNLIFALGIMAIYIVTGREFLLLIVALINFEIIHQLVPFARLDGYWTLVDITGVPDFFSQMTAFVRSQLPVKRWKGRRLPELKWWAKAIFALYALITVPVLGFLIFFMIRGFPRIIATTGESASQHGGTLVQAAGTGDVLGVGASLIHLVALGLPTIGLVIVLFNLVRKSFGALWRWSEPSLARRGAAALGSLAMVGLVVYLWAPELPFASGTPGPLYAQANFEPIQRTEKGTIGDALGHPLSGTSASGTGRVTPEATPAPSDDAAGSGAALDSNSDVTPTAATRIQTEEPRPAVAPASTLRPTPVPTARPATTSGAAPTAGPASGATTGPAPAQTAATTPLTQPGPATSPNQPAATAAPPGAAPPPTTSTTEPNPTPGAAPGGVGSPPTPPQATAVEIIRTPSTAGGPAPEAPPTPAASGPTPIPALNATATVGLPTQTRAPIATGAVGGPNATPLPASSPTPPAAASNDQRVL